MLSATECEDHVLTHASSRSHCLSETADSCCVLGSQQSRQLRPADVLECALLPSPRKGWDMDGRRVGDAADPRARIERASYRSAGCNWQEHANSSRARSPLARISSDAATE